MLRKEIKRAETSLSLLWFDDFERWRCANSCPPIKWSNYEVRSISKSIKVSIDSAYSRHLYCVFWVDSLTERDSPSATFIADVNIFDRLVPIVHMEMRYGFAYIHFLALRLCAIADRSWKKLLDVTYFSVQHCRRHIFSTTRRRTCRSRVKNHEIGTDTGKDSLRRKFFILHMRSCLGVCRINHHFWWVSSK